MGAHNIYNALAAVAVALERGMTPSEAVAALASLVSGGKRGQVVKLGNITVINDCYNSNPKALEAMVDALAAMPAKRRIVVAGEMLELGPAGEELHRQAGEHIAQKKNRCAARACEAKRRAMVEAAPRSRNASGIRATPEEAGRMVGPRDPRRRRGIAESVARSETGKSVGNVGNAAISGREPVIDND